jgi:hypothetical protein
MGVVPGGHDGGRQSRDLAEASHWVLEKSARQGQTDLEAERRPEKSARQGQTDLVPERRPAVSKAQATWHWPLRCLVGIALMVLGVLLGTTVLQTFPFHYANPYGYVDNGGGDYGFWGDALLGASVIVFGLGCWVILRRRRE